MLLGYLDLDTGKSKMSTPLSPNLCNLLNGFQPECPLPVRRNLCQWTGSVPPERSLDPSPARLGHRVRGSQSSSETLKGTERLENEMTDTRQTESEPLRIPSLNV